MEEAGGRRGFGRDRALVVPSCPVRVLPARGAAQGQEATEKKGKREKQGFKFRLWSEGEWRRGGACTLECVRVFCDGPHCHPLAFPVLTHIGTA